MYAQFGKSIRTVHLDGTDFESQVSSDHFVRFSFEDASHYFLLARRETLKTFEFAGFFFRAGVFIDRRGNGTRNFL